MVCLHAVPRVELSVNSITDSCIMCCSVTGWHHSAVVKRCLPAATSHVTRVNGAIASVLCNSASPDSSPNVTLPTSKMDTRSSYNRIMRVIASRCLCLPSPWRAHGRRWHNLQSTARCARLSHSETTTAIAAIDATTSQVTLDLPGVLANCDTFTD